MTNQTLVPSTLLECPKCGKHTIVEHRTGVFRCIACDFERNLDEDDDSRSGGRRWNQHKHDSDDENVNPLPLLLVGGILVALLI
ncbi:MAG: hypothetical protein F6K09_15075 [Merismopedia sp. SIO2A8]|nr:hypothetical protein [Symploca sp. SIO2B6]NET50007.1 hypothetical protein [Merismopedia sp. SIO2A8]